MKKLESRYDLSFDLQDAIDGGTHHEDNEQPSQSHRCLLYPCKFPGHLPGFSYGVSLCDIYAVVHHTFAPCCVPLCMLYEDGLATLVFVQIHAVMQPDAVALLLSDICCICPNSLHYHRLCLA